MTVVAEPDVTDALQRARTPSLAHVLRELERVDVLIRHEVGRARAVVAGDGDLRGLYIDEAEVDSLLLKPLGAPHWLDAPRLHPDVRAAVAAMGDEIERWKAALDVAEPLRLEWLRERYALTDFDRDVLVLCLAPALDLGYERLFSYLHDDVTKRLPTVGLVLDVLTGAIDERIAAMTRFSADAPLVRHGLLRVGDDPSRSPGSPLARQLRIDDRIVSYLLGGDGLDRRLLALAQLSWGGVDLAELVFPESVMAILQSLTDGDPAPSPLVYLHGPYGVGRHSAAAAVAAQLDRPLLTVDLAGFPDDEAVFAELVETALRESDLHRTVTLWQGFDELLDDTAERRRRLLIGRLGAHAGLGFVTGTAPWEPADGLSGSHFIRIELPFPTYRERLDLWQAQLAGGNDEIDLPTLASAYRFTAGQIRDTVATAQSLVRRRSPAGGPITMDDLLGAARLQSHRSFGDLAHEVVAGYGWDDIVLPDDRIEALRDMARFVRHRPQVFDEWGFRSRLAMGRGLTALFVGPSGTGKTMAAQVLANDLGKPLFKIDISAMVSKYIGETEKNLARVFAEAESSNAVLFFDEADALFGKRTEVRDAHDRYANVGTAFLLQRIEEYDGIVVLATNLQRNMDDAFVRRLRYIVEFPHPQPADRLRIWRGIFPTRLPMGDDVDLGFLAEHLEFSGGSIRNVAVAAAFLAASEASALTMRHLVTAAKREYQKMGKVLTGDEFGPYESLLTAGPEAVGG